jgi:hypothetical protein
MEILSLDFFFPFAERLTDRDIYGKSYICIFWNFSSEITNTYQQLFFIQKDV